MYCLDEGLGPHESARTAGMPSASETCLGSGHGIVASNPI